MKQPKTIEEFLNLPERSIIRREYVVVTDDNRAYMEARLGRQLPPGCKTVEFPIVEKGYAYCPELDTIVSAAYGNSLWVLGVDEKGFYRRRA